MKTGHLYHKGGLPLVQKNGISRKSLLLLFFFLLLMLAGISEGEVSAVWEKAINICLSCIGVG